MFFLKKISIKIFESKTMTVLKVEWFTVTVAITDAGGSNCYEVLFFYTKVEVNSLRPYQQHTAIPNTNQNRDWLRWMNSEIPMAEMLSTSWMSLIQLLFTPWRFIDHSQTSRKKQVWYYFRFQTGETSEGLYHWVYLINF